MWWLVSLLGTVGLIAAEQGDYVPWYDNGNYDGKPQSCPCCVSLRDEQGHFATGVIIDEYVVLSINHHRLADSLNDDLEIFIVAGTDDMYNTSSESVELQPRHVFLENPYAGAHGAESTEASVAIWALERPLNFSDYIQPCKRLKSKDESHYTNAVTKGWILDRYGRYKEESRRLKNYPVSILPMTECWEAPERVFLCASMTPKAVNCLGGRGGNPVFTVDGALLGFQTTSASVECEFTLLLRNPVTNARIRKVKKRTSALRKKGKQQASPVPTDFASA